MGGALLSEGFILGGVSPLGLLEALERRHGTLGPLGDESLERSDLCRTSELSRRPTNVSPIARCGGRILQVTDVMPSGA